MDSENVLPVGTALAAVIALVAVSLQLWRLTTAVSWKEGTSPPVGSATRSRAAKKRRPKSERPLGKVRQCRYCQVIIAEDQTGAHLKGKKHKRNAGDVADCWEFVEPPEKAPPPASAEEATVPVSRCEIVGGGRWHTQQPTRRPKSGGQSRTRGTPPPPDASVFRSLPTLGFAVVGSTEPILPLMRSGHKTVELRRAGARLSDGSRLAAYRPGDRFVGVPLAAHLRYQCMLEVAAPISHHESHGAAWEVHRDSAVPRSLVGLVPLRSAAEAQRFYETSFYGGRALCNEPVIAIPVRVVAWLDS